MTSNKEIIVTKNFPQNDLRELLPSPNIKNSSRIYPYPASTDDSGGVRNQSPSSKVCRDHPLLRNKRKK